MVVPISCAYACVFWCFLYPKSGCVEPNGFVAPPLGLKPFVCLFSRHFISLKTKAKYPKPQGRPSSPGPLVSGPLDFEGLLGWLQPAGAERLTEHGLVQLAILVCHCTLLPTILLGDENWD